jgi:hypothetical protein
MHGEPQLSWIQSQWATSGTYGPTCQIRPKSKVFKYMEFKFQSNLAYKGSLNFNSNSTLNFEKFQ